MRWAALVLLLLGVTVGTPADGVSYRVRQAASPHAFSLLDWEVEHVGRKLGSIVGALRGERPASDQADHELIRSFFRAPTAARVALHEQVEPAIERVLTEALGTEGFEAPSALSGGQGVVFPPVSFVFTNPPQVLIVSPRDRIEVAQYVLLEPAINLEVVERLEQGVALRGVSTLVTPIGGLATYPAMVLSSGSAESALAAVAHEWAHAYFLFHPLGRGYWSSQDVRTINETAAELVGDELGHRLARELGLAEGATPRRPGPRQREFNSFMRETRLEVDRLLAAGEVAAAETYMEERRIELNARGFTVRRLNQAYFAFHGSYAEGPAGSSPIAGQVRRLREGSISLGDFMRTIAHVGSVEELARLDGRR